MTKEEGEELLKKIVRLARMVRPGDHVWSYEEILLMDIRRMQEHLATWTPTWENLQENLREE